MQRKAKTVLNVVLVITLAVGVALSANVRIVAHDLTGLSQIVAEHQAEIEDHGHAHEDIVDLMHAYHGHSHDVKDHDHNIAFLPPRQGTTFDVPTTEGWASARYTMPDRRDFGLDRPPRV
ncbi:hypothetical protein A8B78_12950 [Jannaschia sp. EhC01]|nr:hypothetical protein A8B78_12950 [Jannaschia sp. EhC01]